MGNESGYVDERAEAEARDRKARMLGLTKEQMERALDEDAARRTAEQAQPRVGLRLGVAQPVEVPIPLTKPIPTLRQAHRYEFAGRIASALLVSAGASLSDANAARLMHLSVSLADKLLAELEKPKP